VTAPVIPAAGVSAAGLYVPVVASEPLEALGLLADAYDPNTGELVSLRTYVHPVDAAVQAQFRLARGSGVAVLEQGQAFGRIENVTDSTARELDSEARRILEPFVQRRDIAIEKILTEAPVAGTDGDTAMVTVVYRNLLSGRREQVAA
jgi:hypothetical protein